MTIPHKQQKASFTINRTIRAFTLLELILGTVIVALVSLSLFQIFSNGIETYKRAQFTTRTYLQMFKVFDALDNDIASAVKFDYSAADPQWVSFLGQATSLRCVIRTNNGLAMVRYEAVHAHGDMNIIRRQVQPLEDVIAHKNPGTGTVLAGKVTDAMGLEFSFGEKSETNPSDKIVFDWRKEWSNRSLPWAVKVSLRFKPYHSGQKPLEFSRIFYLENH